MIAKEWVDCDMGVFRFWISYGALARQCLARETFRQSFLVSASSSAIDPCTGSKTSQRDKAAAMLSRVHSVPAGRE
jgi:hypothetical protein